MEYLLPLFVAAFAAFLALRWLPADANRQKARIENRTLIFPVSRWTRVLFLGTAAFFGWLTSLSVFGVGKNVPWWVPYLFVGFTFWGGYRAIGEVRLDDSHIEKRFLWLRKSIPWSKVEALVQNPDGQMLVVGHGVEFKFSRLYADFDRLVSEMKERAPALHWMRDLSVSKSS